MASNAEDLVDAVVSRLNGLTLSQSFTAAKLLFPRVSLESISALTVDVFAGGEAWEKQDRSAIWVKTVDVHVVVQDPLGADTNAGIGAGLTLVGEIKADLAAQKLDGRHCVEVEQDEPYAYDLLHTSGLFSAVTTFRYRGF